MIEKIAAQLVRSSVFYSDTKELMKHFLSIIPSPQACVLQLIFSYKDSYHKSPSFHEIELAINQLQIKDAFTKEECVEFSYSVFHQVSLKEEIGDEFLRDYIKEYVSKQLIKDELVKVSSDYNNKSSSDIIESFKKMIARLGVFDKAKRQQIFLNEVNSYDCLLQYHEYDRIPILFKGLDYATYGGIGKNEIVCVIAPSGRGKTVFMINLMHNFALQGYNVLYVSLEMVIEDLIRRFVRRALLKEKEYLSEQNLPEIGTCVRRFFNFGGSRSAIVRHPPNIFSVQDLREELIRFKEQDNFSPDIILIDHLDNMITLTRSIKSKEGFSYWRLLVDDLREVILENSIPIVIPTQGNRGSTQKVVVTESDVGESFGKVQSSDIVLSLNQTPDELLANRMRVCVLKNRDYRKGEKIEIYCDLDRMLMCDLDWAQSTGLVR